MHSSEPASTSSTSPLEGSKLCSPPSPRSIGLLDDTFIKSGVVDKLVQEFQQYYNESKETDYRIHTSTTSSPFKKPNSSLDVSLRDLTLYIPSFIEEYPIRTIELKFDPQ